MITVLVVDDEADIREVLQLTLEDAGYEVTTATNGAEALEVLRHTVPNAIVLDVGMPQIDGWEVLRRIKSSDVPAVSEVPVIMLTAWTSADDRNRGGIEGAVRYLSKPFDPEEVLGALTEVLAEGAPAEPVQRRRVQEETLSRLARTEAGTAGDDADRDAGPRVRLTRLDRPRTERPEHQRPGFSAATWNEFVGRLSPRQRDVVEAVAAGSSVTAIADRLGVSRSNVYAVLRRAARHAGLTDARTLLGHVRRYRRTHDDG